MGRRGPRTQPTEVKIFRGNPGKENLAAKSKSEPKPADASLTPPDILEGHALAMWHRRAPQLAAMKVLTDADRETLTRYCIAWELYILAYAAVKGAGLSSEIASGRRTTTPEATLIRGYHADLLQIEREFGLTPSGRAGIKVDHAEEQDTLASFLNETGS
jgi:P27 family predicted phage terminase small subunit